MPTAMTPHGARSEDALAAWLGSDWVAFTAPVTGALGALRVDFT